MEKDRSQLALHKDVRMSSSGNALPPSYTGQSQSYCSSFPPPQMQASFKLDEGYSEETRSQTGSDAAMESDFVVGTAPPQDAPPPFGGLPEWIMALGEQHRSELAYAILRSLQTSSIAVIVERLNPLLHIDPVAILPPEVTAQIFSYLDPATLLKAGLASRAWRERTLDSQVWRHMYGQEGWGQEIESIRSFERSYVYPDRGVERKSRPRHSEPDIGQHVHKRRARDTGLSGGRGSDQEDVLTPTKGAQALQEARGLSAYGEGSAWSAHQLPADEAHLDQDGQMQGLDFSSANTGSASAHALRQPSVLARDIFLQDDNAELDSATTPFSAADTKNLSALSLAVSPSLMLPPSSGAARISWRYLYKQRKRLEDNWTSGRFSNFQFPHPDYAYEAHTECVYTIQYSRKHLVSGSRDRTLRIWDLDSKRLVRKPLFGHTGSVLCLQFDDSPKEDVIISGSSDTDVIIWCFSTGEIIKKLDHAHRESVLNLKFDHRFLITCSKDKTIRIWNRQTLSPTDPDYPQVNMDGSARYPPYIVNKAAYTNEELENAIARQQIKVLPPYSLLMTLDGHNAAVNAIQIHNNQIASASGDRTVKIWDVHSGKCLQTLQGHTKGIACVQFDGRRVVSGSSDNTVRIYDQATGAEVACLQGHVNLVRTVQAGFADLPGSEEDLRAEARSVDRDFFEARQNGVVADAPGPSRRRDKTRNAGSKDPRNVMAYGAQLPPGGGGSRWGRIVSGSYDETVIIWKKDSDGRWVVCQKLRQEDAVRAAGGPIAALPPAVGWNYLPNGQQQGNAQVIAQGLATSAAANTTHMQQAAHQQAPPLYSHHGPIPASQIVQHAMDVGLIALQSGMQNAALLSIQHPNVQGSSSQNPTQNAPSLGSIVQHGPTVVAPAMAQANPNTAQQARPLQPGLQASANGGSQPNSRVFKLQFDSRRIICCSQDPKIVGWDFANDDEDIISASRFFAGP